MDEHVGAPAARTPGMNDTAMKDGFAETVSLQCAASSTTLSDATPRVQCQPGDRR